MQKHFFSSLTRISDLAEHPFDCEAVPRERWSSGDYVVCEVTHASGALAHVELANGRMAELVEGDLVVGALGTRYATLEAVGTWERVAADHRMELLTSAGLLGKATSVSLVLPPLVRVEYRGHVRRHGELLGMTAFVAEVPDGVAYDRPTVLIVGTSMSAGKTTSAKVIIRQLVQAGHRVTGAKLTGAGRYHDVLAMSDAGAAAIYDFVDVGLPSSYGPQDRFRPHLQRLLRMIAASEPDIVVAEAGASPLEPYNGDTVVDEIGDRVQCMVLCASDPYAVAGVMQGFQRKPDLVAGLATSTSAGIELVEKLTGVPALNVLDRAAMPELRAVLEGCLVR